MDGTANSRRVAELIEAHLDQLLEQTGLHVADQVPWYHDLPQLSQNALFRQDYQALIRMLLTDDIAALRTYLDQAIPARLNRGAPATGLITAAGLMEIELGQLVAAEMADDPARAADTMRRVASVIKNMRMIISGINLRLLMQSTPYS
jgi:hypothetical protein